MKKEGPVCRKQTGPFYVPSRRPAFPQGIAVPAALFFDNRIYVPQDTCVRTPEPFGGHTGKAVPQNPEFYGKNPRSY
jgi:hypothetical protein